MTKLRKKVLLSLRKRHRSEVVLQIDVGFCRREHLLGNNMLRV